jgi:hypothetical protein
MLQAKCSSKGSEFIIASFGLFMLLVTQWILTSVIPGTQYSQGDGKMAQAVIHTALKFGGIFHLNNLNPLQGVGSQLQPYNVWANPAYWPLAMVDSPLALDVSALVALGCLALACYAMARCFDVPVLPSIVAAQLSIILFGPLAYMFVFYQVFWINPGTAVVYAAPLMVLGIIARLEPGRMREFILATSSIFALLLYSLICDPLWSMISGIGLAGALAVVAFSPLRVRTVLVRCVALGCCLAGRSDISTRSHSTPGASGSPAPWLMCRKPFWPQSYLFRRRWPEAITGYARLGGCSGYSTRAAECGFWS